MVLQTHTRTVTLRLSADEYDQLRCIAEARGARSIAEFLRSGLSWFVSNSNKPLYDFITSSPPRNRGPEIQPKFPSMRCEPQTGRPPLIHAKSRNEWLAFEMTDRPPMSERRLYRRYEIRLPVSGRAGGVGSPVITGTTQNVSASGFCLLTEETPTPDLVLRVWIEWPLRSPRGEELHLTAQGKVIWACGNMAGFYVRSWEFREGPLPKDYIPVLSTAPVTGTTQ
jgi:hypothetical protein